VATIPSKEKAARLAEELGIKVGTSNPNAVTRSDVVIFSVKPQVLPSVLREVAHTITPDKLVVSVAAGMQTRFIEETLDQQVPVVRLMPNVAVVAQQGSTGMSRGRWVDDEQVAYVKDLFSSVGLVMEVEEDLMDAVTGLSGTGPMYIFQVIEGLADAGVKVGLSRDQAYALAVQTTLGSAYMARDYGRHPGHLKDLVTSPAGTAIAALHVMERSGFRAILMDAVEEAARRSGELGRLHMKKA
jgi:pyrroline-5-carboxylate reductase